MVVEKAEVVVVYHLVEVVVNLTETGMVNLTGTGTVNLTGTGMVNLTEMGMVNHLANLTETGMVNRLVVESLTEMGMAVCSLDLLDHMENLLAMETGMEVCRLDLLDHMENSLVMGMVNCLVNLTEMEMGFYNLDLLLDHMVEFHLPLDIF